MRRCEQCHTDFEPKHPRARFCSSHCRGAAWYGQRHMRLMTLRGLVVRVIEEVDGRATVREDHKSVLAEEPKEHRHNLEHETREWSRPEALRLLRAEGLGRTHRPQRGVSL